MSNENTWSWPWSFKTSPTPNLSVLCFIKMSHETTCSENRHPRPNCSYLRIRLPTHAHYFGLRFLLKQCHRPLQSDGCVIFISAKQRGSCDVGLHLRLATWMIHLQGSSTLPMPPHCEIGSWIWISRGCHNWPCCMRCSTMPHYVWMLPLGEGETYCGWGVYILLTLLSHASLFGLSRGSVCSLHCNVWASPG